MFGVPRNGGVVGLGLGLLGLGRGLGQGPGLGLGSSHGAGRKVGNPGGWSGLLGTSGGGW